jgi:hypothetical protein
MGMTLKFHHSIFYRLQQWQKKRGSTVTEWHLWPALQRLCSCEREWGQCCQDVNEGMVSKCTDWQSTDLQHDTCRNKTFAEPG